MLPDLLQTDFERILLLSLIGSLNLLILLRGHADHGLQRLNHLRLLHRPAAQHHIPVLNPPGCLHNHMLPGLNLIFPRGKIINLPRIPEPDSNHIYHSDLNSSLPV
jgi:hypothetical protein